MRREKYEQIQLHHDRDGDHGEHCVAQIGHRVADRFLGVALHGVHLRLADQDVEVDADPDQYEREADDALEALDEVVPEELDLVDGDAEELLHRVLLALVHRGAGEEVRAEQDAQPGDDFALVGGVHHAGR